MRGHSHQQLACLPRGAEGTARESSKQPRTHTHLQHAQQSALDAVVRVPADELVAHPQQRRLRRRAQRRRAAEEEPVSLQPHRAQHSPVQRRPHLRVRVVRQHLGRRRHVTVVGGTVGDTVVGEMVGDTVLSGPAVGRWRHVTVWGGSHLPDALPTRCARRMAGTLQSPPSSPAARTTPNHVSPTQ